MLGLGCWGPQPLNKTLQVSGFRVVSRKGYPPRRGSPDVFSNFMFGSGIGFRVRVQRVHRLRVHRIHMIHGVHRVQRVHRVYCA